MQITDTSTSPSLFEEPKSLEQLAAETCALLTRAGVDFALAEAGTGGTIGALLRCSGDGRAALTQERIYATPDALALDLRVSGAKVEAFGAVSAMVAAEAAAELIDTYEGGWGVVAIAGGAGGNAAGQEDVPTEGGYEPGGYQPGGQDTAGIVALGTPSVTVIQQCPAGEVARTVLELLAAQANRRLLHIQSA
jgi:nicotinamide mononucleotide (NMN) deamidase PncC